MENKKEKLEKIIADNKESGVTWQAGETSMLGLTDEEFKLRMGVAEDPEDFPLAEREKIAKANYEKGLGETDETVPTSFDWRSVSGTDYVSPVKNQGHCGSCVAFATTATIDIAMRISANLPASNPTLQDLSEAELFYCGAGSEGRTCGGTNAGWWVSNAMKYCFAHGLAPESKFEYTPGNQACVMQPGWQQEITKPAGYTKLLTPAKMKEWISLSGALTATFAVYADFRSYTSGVYKWNGKAKYEGHHAVCVVGYNDTTQAWICKNSWGQNWGDNGYFEIGYGQCGIDASMYGVNSFESLYPYHSGTNYTLLLNSDGSHSWSPNNPNEQAGWFDGDTLEIVGTFDLNPNVDPLPNANEYVGLCLGATNNNDTTAMDDLLAKASSLPTGTTGSLLGTGITSGAKTDATVFYNATSKVLPSLQLSPSSRGTLENLVYKWNMTYNGTNTVVNTNREVALVFGYAYKLNGIINQ